MSQRVFNKISINPILAGSAEEADSASSVSGAVIEKIAEEADSASSARLDFFRFVFSKNR